MNKKGSGKFTLSIYTIIFLGFASSGAKSVNNNINTSKDSSLKKNIPNISELESARNLIKQSAHDLSERQDRQLVEDVVKFKTAQNSDDRLSAAFSVYWLAQQKKIKLEENYQKYKSKNQAPERPAALSPSENEDIVRIQNYVKSLNSKIERYETALSRKDLAEQTKVSEALLPQARFVFYPAHEPAECKRQDFERLLNEIGEKTLAANHVAIELLPGIYKDEFRLNHLATLIKMTEESSYACKNDILEFYRWLNPVKLTHEQREKLSSILKDRLTRYELSLAQNLKLPRDELRSKVLSWEKLRPNCLSAFNGDFHDLSLELVTRMRAEYFSEQLKDYYIKQAKAPERVENFAKLIPNDPIYGSFNDGYGNPYLVYRSDDHFLELKTLGKSGSANAKDQVIFGRIPLSPQTSSPEVIQNSSLRQ